jgi:hypothetical protein
LPQRGHRKGTIMPRIDTSFILLSAACLVTGVSLGISMGIRHDFQLAPVHAHINLVGWASLALFGLVYRAYPALAQTGLARLHFWLSATSGPIFPFGVYLAAIHDFKPLAIVAALLWLAGAVVFLIAVARMAFSTEAAPMPGTAATAASR